MNKKLALPVAVLSALPAVTGVAQDNRLASDNQ